ncbi:hypothetical protein [Brachybacterium squillarum]|uniref:hypothetical protein n=1 Tax=Brachybacterium squillarum TaxID=661979 RepID=UPI00031F5021|nr:hypothetical protein [Brachybacterium squillarum]
MDTLAILRRFGDCAPHPASDWTATIPLPEEIARFYAEVGPQASGSRTDTCGATAGSS